jgi:hypothetical protein
VAVQSVRGPRIRPDVAGPQPVTRRAATAAALAEPGKPHPYNRAGRERQRTNGERARDVIRRAPWLLDDKGRLPEQRGLVNPGRHDWLDARDPAATCNQIVARDGTIIGDRDDVTLRNKLRERAEALGLPLVDYANTLTMALRHMDGGRAQFLAFVALAASESEDARKFIVCFLELTERERDKANLDLVCQASGASPVRILQGVVGAAFAAGVETANLLAAASFPSTVQAAIETARIPGDPGFKDREMLMKHHGFLPTPKGTVINVSAVAGAQAAAAARNEPSVPRFLGSADAARAARTNVQQQLITEGSIDVDPLATVRAGVAATDGDVVPVARTASVAGDPDAVEVIDGSTR